MITNDREERQADLNNLIEAFERAYLEHHDVKLTEFLPARDNPHYLEARRELLRVDLEWSWQDGRCLRLEDYVRQFPDLLQDRATVQEVAFEEYRHRMLAGEAFSKSEYMEKYGVTTEGWDSSTIIRPAEPTPADAPSVSHGDMKFNLARTLGHGESWQSSRHSDVAQALLRENAQQSSAESAFLLAQALTALPEIGSTFLDFGLIAELGHGSFGRVYLARQGDLANRLVALKITVDLLGEEQKLAQLQHTNVVPIYSAHKAGPYQAVCMPYFGPTTLADVIRGLQGRSAASLSGKDIVQTVRGRKAAFHAYMRPPEEPAKPAAAGAETEGELDRSATLKLLEELGYTDAVLYVAECVTEGLIHAHERGILHRDIKPANILLTDEGRPMLVDFNLSADTKLHTGLVERQMGGTLPYMAPEHLQAMQGTIRKADARSDLYGLGVVLFELLTGRPPFAVRPGHLSETLPGMLAERLQGPPSIRTLNPAVSPAVESIVRQCLQPDPARRYQSAEQLREDLIRQRQHRPLRFAPEPSLRERAQKWVRRHPRLTAPGTIFGFLVFVVLACTAPFAWEILQDRIANWEKLEKEIAQRKEAEEGRESAQKAADANQSQINALTKFGDFEKTSASSRPIMEIISVLQVLPEAWPYEDTRYGETRLAEAMAACRRSLQVYHVLEDADWQRRPDVRDLAAPERDRLRRKIAELLYALTHAEQACLTRLRDQTQQCTLAVAASTLAGRGREVWGAWETAFQARCLTAATWNEQACACFDGQMLPWYLARQKLALAQLRGDGKPAEPFAPLAQKISLTGQPDERTWAGSSLIAEGRFAEALPLLSEATENSPSHAGAWFLLAWCRYNLGEPLKAEFCYDNYLKLQPDGMGIWGHYNRGLLFLKEKNWSSAEIDFSKVVENYPDLAWGYAHRAAARKGMRKNLAGAISDLSHAIQQDPEVPEFYLLRAQLHAVAGNAELAEKDRSRFLLKEPNQFVGWLYRGIAKYSSDPQGALADFEKALALNPRDPLTLINKARLLADVIGRPLEAVKVLDELIELNPQMLDARFKRGILLARAGQRDQAVDDAEQMIRSEPTPDRYYEAASIFAVTSRKAPKDAARALHLLRYALRNGYGVGKYQTDPNLRPLANLKEFRALAVGLEILGAGEPP